MNKNRLLLVYPNQRWFKDDPNTTWNLNPYTLCLLGAMVKDIVDVKIIDAQFYNFSISKFIQQVNEYQPDYVGISVMTTEYSNILDIAANEIKKINRNIVIIAGGVHVTMEYRNVMNNLNIDYAVRGEGEYVFRNLIQFLTQQGPLPKEGIVYREGGNLVITPQTFVADLTKIPRADYSLVYMEDYINAGRRVGPNRPPEYPFVQLPVTRGCPFGCSFCQVQYISGKNVRARDPEDVVDELLFLKNKYDIRSIVFEDDNMVMAKNFFMRMLELMIAKELNLKFMIGAFPIFLLTDEMLELMVRAGCVGVNIAVESGNKQVLKEIIGKPIDLDKVVEMIAKLKQKGLYCLTNFIIGFPGEHWEEIRETIRFAETCGADYVKIFVAVPLRNTRLWDLAKRVNNMSDVEDFKVEWRYSQIQSEEWTAKDISILRAYEWDRINFATPEKRKRVSEIWGISEEELFKIRKQTRDALIF